VHVAVERGLSVFYGVYGVAGIAAAVPTFGISLAFVPQAIIQNAKSGKEGLLKNAEEITQEISSTFENEYIKSLDSQISQIKDIHNTYFSNVQTEKIKTLFNEIEVLKTKLDNAENSPFMHKMKAAKQAHEKLGQSLVGKNSDAVLSTLDFALNDLKQSERYKPVRSKNSNSQKTEIRGADIDHFFAKMEKRKIKEDIRFEKAAKVQQSNASGQFETLNELT